MQKEALPPQLAREGDLMLMALLADLLEAGVDNLVCARDPRMAVCRAPVISVTPGDDVWSTWRACLQDAEQAWLIAPETSGILYQLTQMALEAGCRVIGCTPEAVQLTSSKTATIRHLLANNISCIPALAVAQEGMPHAAGWIVKPDDGVGAEECRHFMEWGQMYSTLARAENQTRRWLVQPYMPGIHASISVICFNGQARVLSCNRQLFQFHEGRGRLEGVEVNGLPQFAEEFAALTDRIARSVPGLRGYVGIDLVIADGRLWVVEINPRLTTAYAGLRRSLGGNPAEWIISAFRNGRLPEMQIKPGTPVTIHIPQS